MFLKGNNITFITTFTKTCIIYYKFIYTTIINFYFFYLNLKHYFPFTTITILNNTNIHHTNVIYALIMMIDIFI